MSYSAQSPSAKRAWIEITLTGSSCFMVVVALCEEGVDRNVIHYDWRYFPLPSPSAKRAWIEMWMRTA